MKICIQFDFQPRLQQPIFSNRSMFLIFPHSDFFKTQFSGQQTWREMMLAKKRSNSQNSDVIELFNQAERLSILILIRKLNQNGNVCLGSNLAAVAPFITYFNQFSFLTCHITTCSHSQTFRPLKRIWAGSRAETLRTWAMMPGFQCSENSRSC